MRSSSPHGGRSLRSSPRATFGGTCIPTSLRTRAPTSWTRIVAEARTLGFAYVGIVVGGVRADGAVWLLPEVTRSHLADLHLPGLRIARAVETGAGAMPKELEATAADYRIARPLSVPVRSVGLRGTSPSLALVAHVGSSVASDATVLAQWVEEARRAGAAVEVGPGPERLDSAAGRQAHEAGVAIHVPTGLGAAPDDPTQVVAIGFARRADVPREGVANARPLGDVSATWSGSNRDRLRTVNGPPRSRSGRKRPAS